MLIVDAIKGRFDAAFARWIERRSPVAASVRLGLGNIYVFPTLHGLVFGAMVLITFVTGVNYQNSLVLLTSFFLAVVFIVSILAAFANLSGLIISARDSEDCFSGDMAVFHLVFSDAQGAGRHRIFAQCHQAEARGFDCVGKETQLSLARQTHRRGRLPMGRVCIDTRYPLGLVRAWSWIQLHAEVVVYPRPVQGERMAIAGGDDSDSPGQARGEGDVAGLREFAQGDSIRRISWKHFASKGALYVKDRENPGESETWLSLDAYAANSLELRLANLCYDIVQMDQSGRPFGVLLHSKVLAPGTGDAHRKQALRALADYQG